MSDQPLPVLKPQPGELTVECPKCHQRVSETRCAYQGLDYYKDCYHYATRPRDAEQRVSGGWEDGDQSGSHAGSRHKDNPRK